ncbi:hypothetical protein NHX12_019163, partial [Muraenolepis orangiensis]
ISELLNRVPRQMLLLLKTNDLLRSIETALHTRASSSSFLHMHRRSEASSRMGRLQVSLGEALGLWRLGLYQVYLQVKGHALVRWLCVWMGFLS